MKKKISHHKRVFFSSAGRAMRNLHITNKNSALRLFSFRYVRLQRDSCLRSVHPNHALIIVLLNGKYALYVENKRVVVGPRSNVYAQNSHSIVIAANTEYTIEAISSDVELACISFASRSLLRPMQHIHPSQNTDKMVGCGTYERRVRTIVDTFFDRTHVVIGETLNKAGKWSSFPPHKHARQHAPHESRFEELYFFRVKPNGGYGFLRLYDNKTLDQTFCVKHNDAVIVSEGFHPVCAAPGCSLYYLWILAGSDKDVALTYDSTFALLPARSTVVCREEKSK